MRIVTIILAELQGDRLKLEHELQRNINSTENIDNLVDEIKKNLTSIALIDNMIKVWNGYTQEITQNNTPVETTGNAPEAPQSPNTPQPPLNEYPQE